MHTEILALGLLATGIAAAQDAAPVPATPPTNSVPAAVAQEPSPWVVSIQQAYTSESNLFHAPEGSGLVVSDRISSTGARIGIDKPIGRQRITAGVEANANRYRSNKQLNNTDYRIGARLDWATVERISGELSAEQQQRLFRESVGGVISTTRNQVRESSAAFQARVGLVTRWSFEGGFAGSESRYTGAAVENRNMRQRSVNANVRWRPSDLLSASVGARHGQGNYPSLGTEADTFKRDDIDFTTTIDASGASRFNARLSATREKHNLQSQRNSDGWTGALGWAWRPTGKVSTNLDLSRDSSVGRTSFDSALISSDTSDARLSEVASLTVTWAATAKIQVVPRASYVRRKLDSTFAAGGGSGTVLSTDRTSVVGLGLRYQPISALELSCEVAREQRTVDGASTLTSPYTANVARCAAQFALR
jgi:hypothetical protein